MSKTSQRSLGFPCLKLERSGQAPTIDKALIYLKLKEMGCHTQEALRFSSKQHCCYDSTQKFDGPSSNRKLRRLDNSKHSVLRNGWQFHSPDFKMQRSFKTFNSPNTDSKSNKDFNEIVRRYYVATDPTQAYFTMKQPPKAIRKKVAMRLAIIEAHRKEQMIDLMNDNLPQDSNFLQKPSLMFDTSSNVKNSWETLALSTAIPSPEHELKKKFGDPLRDTNYLTPKADKLLTFNSEMFSTKEFGSDSKIISRKRKIRIKSNRKIIRRKSKM